MFLKKIFFLYLTSVLVMFSHRLYTKIPLRTYQPTGTSEIQDNPSQYAPLGEFCWYTLIYKHSYNLVM